MKRFHVDCETTQVLHLLFETTPLIRSDLPFPGLVNGENESPPSHASMKIGLVSDTHLPRFGKALPGVLKQGLMAQRVELILHLGDFTNLAVADMFREIAPFDAVAGNNDPEEICRSFGRRKILAVAGLRIGMIHGDGTRKTTLERALTAFAGDAVHVILFGHSHSPYCKLHGDVWLVNPGSPTDKRRNPSYSYAVLEIVNGRATPTLHYYPDRHADL